LNIVELNVVHKFFNQISLEFNQISEHEYEPERNMNNSTNPNLHQEIILLQKKNQTMMNDDYDTIRKKRVFRSFSAEAAAADRFTLL
jgi:hypothetical protein